MSAGLGRGIIVVDERTRHELFGRLEDALGAEHAVTLMEHLPPVGWADVATKHGRRDIDEHGAVEQCVEQR